MPMQNPSFGNIVIWIAITAALSSEVDNWDVKGVKGRNSTAS